MTIHYERVPSLDRRQGRGDDFSGNAWVRWVAVGQLPQDTEAELLDALKNLRAQLRLHVKMNVKTHYSLMVADAAAGTAIIKAEGEA